MTGSKQGITAPPGTDPSYNTSKAAVKSESSQTAVARPVGEAGGTTSLRITTSLRLHSLHRAPGLRAARRDGQARDCASPRARLDLHQSEWPCDASYSDCGGSKNAFATRKTHTDLSRSIRRLLQLTKGSGSGEKPDGAWYPQQVVDYALPKIAKGDFCAFEGWSRPGRSTGRWADPYAYCRHHLPGQRYARRAGLGEDGMVIG